MAYLPTSEKDKEKEQGQGPQAANPVLSSTSGVMPSMGMAAGQSKAPTQSGAYNDVQDYLAANRGEGGRMAGQIAQGVENTAQSGQAGLQAVESDFGSQAAKTPAYQPLDFNDPTKVDPNAFKQQYGAQYQGYQNLSDVGNYGNVVSMLGRAQSQGAMSQTEPGRKELAAETFQKPNYSGGMLSLDQAIMQKQPESQKQFTGLKEKTQGLTELPKAATQRAETVKAEKTAEAKKASEGAKTGYAEKLANYNQQLADRQAKYTAAQPQRMQSALQAYTGQGEAADLYGVRAQDYARDTNPLPTIQNVATEQDRAQAVALHNLAGQVDPSIFQGYATSIPGSADVGKYDPNAPITFDQQAINQARQAGRASLESEINQALNSGGSYEDRQRAVGDALARYRMASNYQGRIALPLEQQIAALQGNLGGQGAAPTPAPAPSTGRSQSYWKG